MHDSLLLANNAHFCGIQLQPSLKTTATQKMLENADVQNDDAFNLLSLIHCLEQTTKMYDEAALFLIP